MADGKRETGNDEWEVGDRLAKRRRQEDADHKKEKHERAEHRRVQATLLSIPGCIVGKIRLLPAAPDRGIASHAHSSLGMRPPRAHQGSDRHTIHLSAIGPWQVGLEPCIPVIGIGSGGNARGPGFEVGDQTVSVVEQGQPAVAPVES